MKNPQLDSHAGSAQADTELLALAEYFAEREPDHAGDIVVIMTSGQRDSLVARLRTPPQDAGVMEVADLADQIERSAPRLMIGAGDNPDVFLSPADRERMVASLRAPWTSEQFWEYVDGLLGELARDQMRDMLAERGLSIVPAQRDVLTEHEFGGYIEHGLRYGISSKDGRTCARNLLLHFDITPKVAAALSSADRS